MADDEIMKKTNSLYSGAGSEFDESKHPRNEKGEFSEKGETIVGAIKGHFEKSDTANVDKGLVEFVKNIDKLPDKAQYMVGEVSDRERQDIERITGEKLNATQHVINASEIKHILKRHGPKGTHDKSMANINDIAKIGLAIRDYDYIELIGKKAMYLNDKGERASIVLYHKKIDDKTQIVAEALVGGKYGKLRILSAYKTKKSP